jgi:hypothetical protein
MNYRLSRVRKFRLAALVTSSTTCLLLFQNCSSVGSSELATSSPTNIVAGGTPPPVSGATCPQASAVGDGCSAAPAGTSQAPTLLASYGANRPPWNVAGVDYAVGVPSGTSLTDWQSLSGPGVSINLGGHTVTLTNANNTVINAVDFSLHGGANLSIANSPNVTISNCNFGGTNLQTISNAVIWADIDSPNLTIINNVIDGAGSGSGSTLVSSRAGGSRITLEYNWFKNFPQHVLELVQDAGSASFTVTYKYNFIEQGAMTPSAHLNYLQFGNGTASSVDIEFNTTLAHNTAVSVGGAQGTSMSYMIHGGSVTNGLNEDNYFDSTSAWGAYYPGSMTSAEGWASSGNTNMVTGATITPQ